MQESLPAYAVLKKSEDISSLGEPVTKSRRPNLIARHLSRTNSEDDTLQEMRCEFCLRRDVSGDCSPADVINQCLCCGLEQNDVVNIAVENIHGGNVLEKSSMNLEPCVTNSRLSSSTFSISPNRFSQMSHPSVTHIPPRSPHHPRKTTPPSHLLLTSSPSEVYRPLSSISSSSSSSSNSLPRGQAGINTSYLASVESLVENDRSSKSGSSGTATAGGATRRRERSLKIRRDIRGHISRPGMSTAFVCHITKNILLDVCFCM